MSKEGIVKAFFESKKNANCILDIEKKLLSEDEHSILSSMDIVQELFSQIFQKHMLQDSSAKGESEKKFRDWLLTRYNDFVSHLLVYLSHQFKEVQIKALEVLMKFVVLEAKYPLAKINPDEWFFPKLLFQKIISEFLSDILDQDNLITKFQAYISFDDIKLYALKAVRNILSQKKEVTDIFLNNCFFVLSLCSPSKNYTTFLSQEGVLRPFTLKKNLFSKTFSNAWGIFLKYELPLYLLKKVLLVLPKKVLHHFQNPCLLTDFLTNLYNKGGLTSLLALSGLFELMQKYNVEYPDFFIKLYSLFNDEIINGNYKSTFFYLSDLFLSSTHLPAYMVAAFMKRLSRLSLQANEEALVKILPLIRNLLVRHPTLHILLHHTEPKDVDEDPFDNTVTDPAASKAMESSLWEIKTLQKHYNVIITQKVKITNEIPKLEFNLTDVLDISIEHLYLKNRKRKCPEVTIAEKPEKLRKCLDFSL